MARADPHPTEEIRMREKQLLEATGEGSELVNAGSASIMADLPSLGRVTGTMAESSLVALAATDPQRRPFHVYLARLSPGSRPTMSEALTTVARIASGGHTEAHLLPWQELRYQHVQAIRAALTGSVS